MLPTDTGLCFVEKDRFSEVLFHVSSITNVKRLDKGRFSVYFRKKRYDFMAHNNGRSMLCTQLPVVFLLRHVLIDTTQRLRPVMFSTDIFKMF